MRWKRELHRQHGTRLVETYSYESQEGSLLAALESRLRTAGVVARPLPEAEVRALVGNDDTLSPVADLLGTFLSVYKGNGWTLEELRRTARAHPDSSRLFSFLQVFEALLERYEESLRSQGELDFDDMIARAADYVERGLYKSPFTHVIVDEFQDIARGRSRLLVALLSQHHQRQLFCVGDDWQSIYRFAGSDIAIMTSFADVFGYTRRTDLDRTFRFNDKLLSFSTTFVTQNPKQLRKRLTSQTRVGVPAVTVLVRQIGDPVDAPLRNALGEISRRENTAERVSVLLLGRYRHTCPKNLAALQRRYSQLDLQYKTAHSSKGLEADYAIVLDLVSGAYGFPSEVTDDPVLELVLADASGYPNAEERRLFYVAVTRGRRHVYLLTDSSRPSAFAEEVQTPPYAGMIGGVVAAPVPCPECGGGVLLRYEGRYGTFWKCRFTPYCEGKAQACRECGTHPRVPSGRQLRCTNPACR